MTPLDWVQEGDAPDLPRVAVQADGTVVIEWQDFARMRLHRDNDHSEIEWLGEVAPLVLQKFEQGAGKTMPRYVQGALVLHASAVAIGEAALIILGDAGAGKSTTAAALCAKGATLLSDDSTVVASGRVEPIESMHWLCADAAAMLRFESREADGKSAIPARNASHAMPVKTIVRLSSHDGPLEIQRSRGMAALQPIIDSALRLPLGSSRAVHDFTALVDLASSAEVFRVLRSRDFSVTFVDELTEALLGLVRR